MLNQSISKKNLRYLGVKTWKKYSPQSKYVNFLQCSFDKISAKTVNDEYFFSIFKVQSYKGKTGYDFTCPEDEIVARKVNDNLRRLFKIHPSDRHAIVKQTISLAKDSQPITIARLDIKDFYESLDRKEIINFVVDQWLLSYQSKLALKNWDQQLSSQGIKGLPRGMSLSSTLSEIRIRNFDKAIKHHEGVYFYARYVDDIIIFYSDNIEKLKTVIVQSLSQKTPELEINFNKSQFHSLNVYESTQYAHIDYLGYKISAAITPCKIDTERDVKVSISDKKIKKIKHRIRKSLMSYRRERNYRLLLSRLRFLSGNQYIIGDIDRTKLKSGIFYNYPLINDYRQLKELDTFYKKLITCKKKPINEIINMIKNHGGNSNDTRINQLHNISFKFGFHKKLMNTFPNEVIKKIKRCW